MHIVGQLKRLVCNSRLFVDEEKLGKKAAGKKRTRRRDDVKIGQGGTLDPLADGVLGQYIRSRCLILLRSTSPHCSGRRWQRNEEIERSLGLHKGAHGVWGVCPRCSGELIL